MVPGEDFDTLNRTLSKTLNSFTRRPQNSRDEPTTYLFLIFACYVPDFLGPCLWRFGPA